MAIPVWVRLPNLPIHCWNWDSLKHIGDALGKFSGRENNKYQYDCARICVEVDLEVGLSEAIKINVGSWSHIQKLDYEKIILYRDSKEEEIQSTEARRRIRPKGLHQTIHPCLSLLWE